MRRETCELVVLGSGFGGSLIAAIAGKLGLDVVLLERARHPRFAIGESSTPLANHKLKILADTYDLDWLKPFATYGSWKNRFPKISCGLKRGFSFFRHSSNQPFHTTISHENDLMVAANENAEQGDTHWFRSDFDAFLVDRAIDAGVRYIDRCDVRQIDHENGWRFRGTSDDGPYDLGASFVVDATGQGSLLASALGVSSDPNGVQTNSRALYGHFENVQPWNDVLDTLAISRVEHPFSADTSALHHVFDGGWMWVLRFDNGVTSAGFSLGKNRPARPDARPEDEWARLLRELPSISRQFANARLIQPTVSTGRLQRRISTMAGNDWAMLPHAAMFVDPWLSPGIAHTLFGIERLARLFADARSTKIRTDCLGSYNRRALREFDQIDRITDACFSCFNRFSVLVNLTMLYFVAVTYAECRSCARHHTGKTDFMLADDERFVAIVRDVTRRSKRTTAPDAGAFGDWVRDQLRPYNVVGLCDPADHNMYPFVPYDMARFEMR